MKFARLNRRTYSLASCVNVIVGIAFGCQIDFKIIEMEFQQSLLLFFCWINQLCFFPFHLFDQFVEHGLGVGFIGGERDAFFAVVGGAVAAPPFLGFGFDGKAGFRVGDSNRFFIETSHLGTPKGGGVREDSVRGGTGRSSSTGTGGAISDEPATGTAGGADPAMLGRGINPSAPIAVSTARRREG